jgi:hypothetical protein
MPYLRAVADPGAADVEPLPHTNAGPDVGMQLLGGSRRLSRGIAHRRSTDWCEMEPAADLRHKLPYAPCNARLLLRLDCLCKSPARA